MTINNPRDFHELPAIRPEGRMRYRQVAELISVSEMTVRRWCKADKFPKPIMVNDIPFFENQKVLDWLEQTSKLQQLSST